MRRLTSSLKEQHWVTIAIELIIVIIGVFIGTQVSNWNEQRAERRATARLLDQMIPELDSQIAFFESAKRYFATTRPYANVALAEWRGQRSVDASTFVIAAYQATQIYGTNTNTQNWAITFGADQLRDIDDPQIRRDLALVLTSDYGPVALNSLSTPYREKIRHLIPIEIQEQIRLACGDRDILNNGMQQIIVLPPECGLKLSPAAAGPVAATLRAHGDLADELDWHLAETGSYLENARVLEMQMKTLEDSLKRRGYGR